MKPFHRNNFLRLCVLKVTQQSEKHLEKILNVDEFVKRVFSVIHSNDPVARAITLRYTEPPGWRPTRTYDPDVALLREFRRNRRAQ